MTQTKPLHDVEGSFALEIEDKERGSLDGVVKLTKLNVGDAGSTCVE